jgi:hypothetical protein
VNDFDPANLTREEVEGPLEEEEAALRGLAILHGAMVAAPVLFAGVVAVLAATTPERSPVKGSFEMLEIMSGVHALLGASAVLPAFLLPASALARRARELRTSDQTAAGFTMGILPNIRGMAVIHRALLEGVALFGLMVCLLAVLQGDLKDHPILLLNGASAAFNLLEGAFTFPTRANVAARIISLGRGTRDGGPG